MFRLLINAGTLHLVNDFYLERLACVCALLLSFWLIWTRAGLKRDLAALRRAVSSLVRRNPLPDSAKFHSPEAADVFHSIVSLLHGFRTAQSLRPAYEQLLSLTSAITEAADEEITASEKVVSLLVSQAGTDVCAAAVILINQENNRLYLPYSWGIPRKRIEPVLELQLESLLGWNKCPTTEARWGYSVPDRGSVFDLSALGVRSSYITPLKAGDRWCGALWLGFRTVWKRAAVRRISMIEALCRHAAAIFNASQKVRARAEQSESQRDLLLGMSHDLRSPGTTALYAVQDLLEQHQLPASQRASLEIIEQSIKDQLAIVTDVLDLTRHQRGKLFARPEKVSLLSLISQCCARYADQAVSRSIKLQIDWSQDLDVWAAESHCKRILDNLISNAFKYTENGSITVRLIDKQAFAEVQLADTGIGIPEDQLPLLYSNFCRLNNVGERTGTGLGLAVSKMLIELNGGYLQYRRNVPQGSVFSFALPLARASVGVTEPKYSFNRAGTPPRILVVDDDPAACRVMQRWLKDLDVEISLAHSCHSAAELIAQLKPQLLITDFYLSDGSANTLLATLRASRSITPVIVITGSGGGFAELKAADGHLIEVLEKPVCRQTLCERAAELLR